MLFGSIQTQLGGISYVLGSGDFVINQTGYYLVNWWVATDGAGPATSITFELTLNGVTVSGASTPIVTGQLSGTSLIAVSAAASTIQLVNNTGELANLPPITVQAGITIVRVASI